MDWLHDAARRNPHAPALIVGESTVPYGDLDGLADRVAAAVAAAGPQLGSRVAYWGEQNLRAVAAAWGIPRAGAWAVPLSTRLPAATAMALTRRAGVGGLWALASDAEMHRLRPALGGPPQGGPPDPRSRFVVFSSGTGGRQRGVVLSGANVAAAVAASRARIGNESHHRWLCVLPTSHVGGLSILWRCAERGAAVVLEERFDAVRVAGLLAEGQVECASLVPTMLRRILEAHPGPYHQVVAVLVGGGPADPALLERALDAGLPVLATYGSTETCSQVATVVPGAERASLGTVGPPLDGFEVRIGPGGRIEVRGPAVAAGDLDGVDRPVASWVMMGDLGGFDAEGRLVVRGRADRVVVTGGTNVHAEAVEQVLADYPGLADVHVRGEPDPEWGNAVVADVVVAEGHEFDAGEVASWAGGRLARHEIPKRWRVVESIERTELGKHPGAGG